MKDNYLWDRSGPPDPEVERLERTLAPLRYRHRGEVAGLAPQRSRAWMAAAAAVVMGAIAISQFAFPLAPNTAWQVSSVEGAVRAGGRQVGVSMALRRGQVLRTGTDARLTLEAGDVGRVDLGPDSEMRAATDRRLQLDRGQLHAFIWAPARQFVVDTPSAHAVDLGCEYTLNIENNGDGLLKVAMGWVAFRFAGHESFIPEGAECVTRKKEGPGIPYYQDAPAGLKDALGAFERGDRPACARILAEARPRDGLTLWHLLTRVDEQDRGAVFDRFAQLVTLPAGVLRAGVVRQDAKTIDLCWDALNLKNTGWWRGWERKWE
jgi:hypothetical protein